MTNELVKKEESSLAVPDWVNEMSYSNDGLEDIGAEDFVMPRLSVIQTSSGDFKNNTHQAGIFANSMSGESYGNEVDVVFLKASKSAVYLKMGQGLICKSDDLVTSIHGDKCAQCPYNEYWNEWKDGNAPKCKMTYDFITVTANSIEDAVPNLMMTSFSKTAIKTAKKKIISRARALGKPLYSQIHRLKSVFTKDPRGDYYSIDVSYPGWVTKEQFESLKRLKEIVSGKKYNVDTDIDVDSDKAPSPSNDIDL